LKDLSAPERIFQLPVDAHRYLTEAEKLLDSGASANAQTS